MFLDTAKTRTGQFGLLFLCLVAYATLWGVLHAPQPLGHMSSGVGLWWTALSAIGIANVYVWCLSAAAVSRRAVADEPTLTVFQRRQVLLSAVYVLGCGFRAILPRADVQRIGLYDSWMSSVMVGRSVATVAEVCFAIQWALLLHALAKQAGSRTGVAIAKVLVPLIVVAEICSWQAVLTTSYLGNTLEESIWALSAALLVTGLLSVWPRSNPAARPFLATVILLGVCYVTFMVTVDVPMYFTRWLADEANGKSYLTLSEGCRDVWCRRDVTFDWEAWRAEVPWMTLYFSVGVWVSIALTHVPWLKRLPAGAPQRG